MSPLTYRWLLLFEVNDGSLPRVENEDSPWILGNSEGWYILGGLK